MGNVYVLSERKSLKLNTFANMCNELANLSHDEKYKVACLIFTNDFREICSIGYNGNYKGGPNIRESLETGKSGFLHAEENALYHLCKDFNLRKNLIMLCTHTPCPMCAKRIVNAGIKNVIYINDYFELGNETKNIFENSDIFCGKLDNIIQMKRFGTVNDFKTIALRAKINKIFE
jgi:dCMP deaminase